MYSGQNYMIFVNHPKEIVYDKYVSELELRGAEDSNQKKVF